MKKWIENKFYILIALYASALFLANDMFLPAIGSIATSFHTSSSSVSLGVGAWLAGCVLFQLPAGVISDKLGYRHSLLLSGVFFGVITLLVAFSKNIEVFLFLRVLQGAGTCMFSSAGIASVNEYYEDKKAILALSLTVNIILISPIIGPILGATILTYFNWQGVFEWDLVYLAIILILLWLGMPDVKPRYEREESTGFLELFKGLNVALQNKAFMMQCVSIGFFAATFLTWITIAPHMFMDNLGLTSSQYAYWQIPVLCSFLIGNTIAPVLAHRFPSISVVRITMYFVLLYALIAMGVILAFPITTEVQPEIIGLLLILLPLGGLFFIRGINNAPHEQYTLSLQREYQGSSASVLQFINMGLAAMASISASYLYGLTNAQYELMMLSCACISAVLFLISFYSNKQRKTKA